MRIDLHCHTRPLSACSALEPGELVARSRAAGLDAICLTEHDRLPPADLARRLSEESGLLVLRGAEVTTELGHVLVYGIETLPPLLGLARPLVAAVRAAGGIAALAHPARDGTTPPGHVIAELFDCVEVLNGSDGAAQNDAAAGLTAWTPLPGIAGSDCHALHEVGTVATVLPAAVRTERELAEALRMGGHRVERLRRRDERVARGE